MRRWWDWDNRSSRATLPGDPDSEVFDAFVPDPIGEWEPVFGAAVWRKVVEAEAALSALAADPGAESAAWLLSRAEAASSSIIESVRPVGAHNSVVGADQGLRAPSWDQESVRDSVHEDSASARIAAGQRPRPSFRHPQDRSKTQSASRRDIQPRRRQSRRNRPPNRHQHHQGRHLVRSPHHLPPRKGTPDQPVAQHPHHDNAAPAPTPAESRLDGHTLNGAPRGCQRHPARRSPSSLLPLGTEGPRKSAASV